MLQLKQETEYDFGEQFACYRLLPKENTTDLKEFLEVCKPQILKILQLERDTYGSIHVWIKLKTDGIENLLPFNIGKDASFCEFIIFCFAEIEKCNQRITQAINSLEIFVHPYSNI